MKNMSVVGIAACSRLNLGRLGGRVTMGIEKKKNPLEGFTGTKPTEDKKRLGPSDFKVKPSDNLERFLSKLGGHKGWDNSRIRIGKPPHSHMGGQGGRLKTIAIERKAPARGKEQEVKGRRA